MPITQEGFCIHLKRLRQEKRLDRIYSRTVGDYECFWNGKQIEELRGQMVERGGPGDNTTAIGNKKDLRIAAGIYPLAIHAGTKYRTIGYSSDERHGVIPRPGILLKETHERTAILIHPGQDYISSFGCLNPAWGLVDAKSAIDYVTSRRQVISIIDTMANKLGTNFPKSSKARIPGAIIWIEGEP